MRAPVKIIFCFFTLLFLSIPCEAKIISVDPVSLIILGPPCTKPGEVAVQVSSTLNIPIITPSFLVLNELYDESEKSDKARDLLSQNKPIPTQLLLDLLTERLKLRDCNRGYILNSFFHSTVTAQELIQFLSARSKPIFIILVLPDDEVLARKSQTFICSECGRVYHAKDAPPLVSGTCDTCQLPLTQCEDDKEATVRKILDNYHKKYDPILEYIRQNGTFLEIDLKAKNTDDAVDAIVHQFEKSITNQNALNRFLSD